MRVSALAALCLALVIVSANAQVQPDSIKRSVLPEPAASWFLINGWNDAYVFDAADGQMKGLISHGPYTPAVVTSPARKEIYLVDSFYSRGVTGIRSDVLTVVDMSTLATKTEIDIPDKAGALPFRHHIGLLGDARHVVVFNMTPAQSVSIVDVVDREFAGEISTAGCAIIMPSGERGFLMICGDGRLQLIELDESGKETNRIRSEPFFVVDEDPVFARPVRTAGGWILITHEGLVRDVSADSGKITVGEAWSMLNAEDKEQTWRPGGAQPFAMHRNTQLLYSLMHKGKIDTQDAEGTEIWVFDPARRKRVARLVLPVAGTHILSSQEATPRLYAFGKDKKLRVYNGFDLRLMNTMEQLGIEPGLMQTLTEHD